MGFLVTTADDASFFAADADWVTALVARGGDDRISGRDRRGRRRSRGRPGVPPRAEQVTGDRRDRDQNEEQ